MSRRIGPPPASPGTALMVLRLFLGVHIVFGFAWLPFVLTGASGQIALDNALDRVARSRRIRLDPTAPALTRRAVMQRALGAVGFATLALGGLAALSKGTYKGSAH